MNRALTALLSACAVLAGCATATEPPPPSRVKIAPPANYLAPQTICDNCAAFTFARDEGMPSSLNSIYISVDGTDRLMLDVSQTGTIYVEPGMREVCLQSGPRSMTFPECEDIEVKANSTHRHRIAFDATGKMFWMKKLKPEQTK